MKLIETVERTIPAVIAVGLTFALNAWNQSHIDALAREKSAASQSWVEGQIAPVHTLAMQNQRVNIRQDQLWARICERQKMQCDLRDTVLRWPGNPPVPAPGRAAWVAVHDKRERENRGGSM